MSLYCNQYYQSTIAHISCFRIVFVSIYREVLFMSSQRRRSEPGMGRMISPLHTIHSLAASTHGSAQPRIINNALTNTTHSQQHGMVTIDLT